MRSMETGPQGGTIHRCLHMNRLNRSDLWPEMRFRIALEIYGVNMFIRRRACVLYNSNCIDSARN